MIFSASFWSSLFYNTITRHKRHQCDTSDTNATQARHERHEWDKSDTSATQTTRVRHGKFWLDNDTSENIFLHPYISYMANESLRGEEQCHSKNYLLEMLHSHSKMRLKSAPQKLNFVMAKAISKTYILDVDVAANALARSRIVTHSNTASFFIKTILCET